MAMAAVLCLAGCCKKAEVKVYSVDEAIAAAPELVGDTIQLEGMCVGVCKHGCRVFMHAEESDQIFMVMAAEGSEFCQDLKDKKLHFTAVIDKIEPVVEEPKSCEHDSAAVEEVAAEEVAVEEIPADTAVVEEGCCQNEAQAQEVLYLAHCIEFSIAE